MLRNVMVMLVEEVVVIVAAVVVVMEMVVEVEEVEMSSSSQVYLLVVDAIFAMVHTLPRTVPVYQRSMSILVSMGKVRVCTCMQRVRSPTHQCLRKLHLLYI